MGNFTLAIGDTSHGKKVMVAAVRALVEKGQHHAVLSAYTMGLFITKILKKKHKSSQWLKNGSDKVKELTRRGAGKRKSNYKTGTYSDSREDPVTLQRWPGVAAPLLKAGYTIKRPGRCWT